MNALITALARDFDHLSFWTKTEYHGSDCLWCHLSSQQKQEPLLTSDYRHPLAVDFKINKRAVKTALLVGDDDDKNNEKLGMLLRNRYFFDEVRTIPKKINNTVTYAAFEWLVHNLRPGDLIVVVVLVNQVLSIPWLVSRSPEGVHLTVVVEQEKSSTQQLEEKKKKVVILFKNKHTTSLWQVLNKHDLRATITQLCDDLECDVLHNIGDPNRYYFGLMHD